jgi:hypothetical protein
MSFVKRIAGASTLGAALLLGVASAPAQAGYIVTLEQVGGDVVATGSGPIDLMGLSFGATNDVVFAAMVPIVAGIFRDLYTLLPHLAVSCCAAIPCSEFWGRLWPDEHIQVWRFFVPGQMC